MAVVQAQNTLLHLIWQKNYLWWNVMNEIKKSPDSNVEKNREMLLQRSIVGLAKYGVTTDNNPLTLRAWLQHALEEALDMANYLQAAISKLDKEGAEK